MSEEDFQELTNEIGAECPRRVIGELHARGLYVHYTTPAFPGKVLCLHRDSTSLLSGNGMSGALPTEAQKRLWCSYPLASGACHAS